jgi:SNF2 family DNA or RNA helicase
VPTFKLALTLYIRDNILHTICKRFIEINIFPQTPKNYEPSQHLGSALLKISPAIISSPEKISNKHYDPQLLSIPSGCDLPHTYPPKHIIKSRLLPHQAQGLSFVIDRESSNSASAQALWLKSKMNNEYLWEHKFSGQKISFSNPTHIPETPLGSILADDMGLGKSLQAISLIAISQAEASQFSSHSSGSLQSTLIICPARLLNNWINEIEKHTHTNTMKLFKYHGPHRYSQSSINLIISANVIVRTYDIFCSEFQDFQSSSSSKQSLIFTRCWFRVILDEAQ